MDGTEALSMSEHQLPDVVISDIVMPNEENTLASSIQHVLANKELRNTSHGTIQLRHLP